MSCDQPRDDSVGDGIILTLSHRDHWLATGPVMIGKGYRSVLEFDVLSPHVACFGPLFHGGAEICLAAAVLERSRRCDISPYIEHRLSRYGFTI